MHWRSSGIRLCARDSLSAIAKRSLGSDGSAQRRFAQNCSEPRESERAMEAIGNRDLCALPFLVVLVDPSPNEGESLRFEGLVELGWRHAISIAGVFFFRTACELWKIL